MYIHNYILHRLFYSSTHVSYNNYFDEVNYYNYSIEIKPKIQYIQVTYSKKECANIGLMLKSRLISFARSVKLSGCINSRIALASKDNPNAAYKHIENKYKLQTNLTSDRPKGLCQH